MRSRSRHSPLNTTDLPPCSLPTEVEKANLRPATPVPKRIRVNGTQGLPCRGIGQVRRKGSLSWPIASSDGEFPVGDDTLIQLPREFRRKPFQLALSPEKSLAPLKAHKF